MSLPKPIIPNRATPGKAPNAQDHRGRTRARGREARYGFGRNVVATIAYLATHLHASVRATKQALEELFGIEVSTGAIILQRREVRVSQRSESAEGARFVAGMLTVVETLRLQGRGVLAYLREAIT